MTKSSRKTLALGVCLLLIASSALSCADIEREVRRNPKTAVGAATGAAGGALLGGLIFRSTAAAIAGGLLGGLAGGVIGDALESQRMEYAETARAFNYSPAKGTLVDVQKVEVLPASAKPGETVQLVTHYALLPPSAGEKISVTERREIFKDGQLVGNPVLTVQREGGTWASTVPLTIPSNAPAGDYRLNVTVQGAGSSDSQSAAFTVKKG